MSRVNLAKEFPAECVVRSCINGARRATLYLHPKLIVRASRTSRPDRRSRYTTLVVTIGAPSYAERQFIKLCKKAKVRFPILKPILKFYPKKKK